ncbi:MULTISPECIES: hypothetical protein [Proteus]|uniref:hypothetical protein n=1 Tax=Proteus TaxID=583 RepID=UPI001300AA22|nr:MULTISPECIES: hypothetical protein [Proteus]ELA8985067.1 hypothetical protein [Proteus mirabilis]ELA9901753.1 hypothetical protein [Proteus mirabilis]ELA9917882.1 hypothetical protein [Proteus mirabilis]MBG5985929.1 hypothetical protein [Proteus vulgaris]MBI6354232.1 hypothetical protein [Proteus mirabilis]
MKNRAVLNNTPPSRRDVAVASPYTKSDLLNKDEKKERSDKFRSSLLRNKYFKL